MQSFRHLDRHLGLTPASILRQLSAIDTGRGQQNAFRRQSPEALKTLTEIARIQSVEASNAIEHITAPARRIKELVAQKTTPRNRSEAEIAGYRAVLEQIHSNAAAIPFKPTVVEQLQRDLYQFTGIRAGRWKTGDNIVEEELPDGTKRIRFKPVTARETPAAMQELHERFNEAWGADTYHRLQLTGVYVLDFLAIHPFSDGNGRMSRLLTLLLLYRSDYEVGRFISIEKLIEQTKESYYDALGASTTRWHDGEHDLGPWLSYFLGILVAAYREFEQRVGVVSGGRGTKAAAIRSFIGSRTSDLVAVEDVRRAVPSASDVYIREVLRKLRKEGVLKVEGVGPQAKWRRVRADFE